jgi:pimeloyl-ACP methyl ester carboxylesterase
MSSFAVVDALLADLATPGRFPSVSDVVVVGHSAGGQFANRYAAGSPEAAFRDDIRFMVANPSSYLYFDPVRYDEDAARFAIPETDCSGYDRYKYGMDDRNRYMEASSATELRDRYRDRRVTYLLGALDTGEHDDSLDVSCEGRIQGPNRLERGQRYFDYLGLYLGPDVYRTHELLLVRGVGHDGEAMLNAMAVRQILLPPSGG